MIIYVEGNIGSGKSTLMNILKKHFKSILCILEPVDEWVRTKDTAGTNILQHFYKDPHQWSFPFQMNTFITRVQKIALIPPNKNAIVERSVFTDKHCFAKNLYESNLLHELEWTLYNRWFTWLCDTFNIQSTAYIYLRTTPDTCFDRIQQRSRNGESSISLDYLNTLHEKHETWMATEQDHGTPVLTIDVNQDFEHTPEQLQTILNQIDQFIKKID